MHSYLAAFLSSTSTYCSSKTSWSLSLSTFNSTWPLPPLWQTIYNTLTIICGCSTTTTSFLILQYLCPNNFYVVHLTSLSKRQITTVWIYPFSRIRKTTDLSKTFSSPSSPLVVLDPKNLWNTCRLISFLRNPDSSPFGFSPFSWGSPDIISTVQCSSSSKILLSPLYSYFPYSAT